ncbi:hypothetical protein LWI29_036843 [Acer saccharum]|uniref:Uncharacterized protein n=1 Tax=Acer saccharum TaxID=4024 RepID=A0AA39S5J1_ACESA|nr:hypothetical protein LWI29_036843 [Acer saccharum]
MLGAGDYAGKDMIDAEASVEVNRDIFLTDEMVEQKFHIESPLLAAPTLSGEDETYKPEDNAKTKLEESLPVISDDTEIFSSRADKIPCLMEGGAPPDLEETAHKEEKVNETEENNETKDDKIAKEDLQLVAETSEASTESIVLEPKSERDKMVVEDDTQKEEPEELYKDSKTDGEGEDTEKQNTVEECVTPSILAEPIGEKSLKSFQEDQKEEDGPKIEVYAEPELASACVDAGRQLTAEENTVDQCKDLDVKETVQSSEEDDTATKLSKQDNDTCISVESIERETVESSQGNKYKAENSEAENSREQIIEEGLIPESIEQDPTQNFNDEIQKTGKSTGEILEISETAKAVESIAHETTETTEIPTEILDTSPVKHEENFLSKGKITEASLEEKNEEEIYSVIVAEEKVDAKEDTAKKPLKMKQI